MNKLVMDAFNAGLIVDMWGTTYTDSTVLRQHINDERWITINNAQGRKGSKVKISASGEILEGMGGKFNGQKIDEMGKGGNSNESNSVEQSLSLYKQSIKSHSSATKEYKKLTSELENLQRTSKFGNFEEFKKKESDLKLKIKQSGDRVDKTRYEQTQLNNKLPAYLRSSSSVTYKP